MIDLVSKEKCTGCTACAASCLKNAISLNEDDEGFLYPAIDQNLCVECTKCIHTCPITNLYEKNPVLESYIAINTDSQVREASASGGIFSVIATWVLNKGGVVFGASFDSKLVVRHIAIETKKDLKRLQMSKYVQSNLKGVFKLVKSYLKNNRLILFSGTPCQVAGLTAYLGKKYDNLLLLDVVCHGVPSPKLFEDYKAAVEKMYKCEIANIFFRSKIIGHYFSTILVKFKNGKAVHSTRIVKSYPRLWFAGFISRPSCYNCHFKEIDRVSDFTLFDSFRSADTYHYYDNDMGLSNVYLRTDRAIKVWTFINKNTKSVKTDYHITSKKDGDMIFKSTVRNEKRSQFWLDYERLPYNELIDKYIPYSKKERGMDIMKRVLVKTGLNRNVRIKKILTKFK